MYITPYNKGEIHGTHRRWNSDGYIENEWMYLHGKYIHQIPL